MLADHLDKQLQLGPRHPDYFLSDKRNRGTISRAPVVFTSTGKLHTDKRRYYTIKLLELERTVHPHFIGVGQCYPTSIAASSAGAAAAAASICLVASHSSANCKVLVE